jgi:gluconate kinase
LEAFIEGDVIEIWRNHTALKIAQSDDDRMERIRKISDEMAQLQEQKERGAQVEAAQRGRSEDVPSGHAGARRNS